MNPEPVNSSFWVDPAIIVSVYVPSALRAEPEVPPILGVTLPAERLLTVMVTA